MTVNLEDELASEADLELESLPAQAGLCKKEFSFMDAVAETQSKEETSVEKTYDLSIVKSASAVSEMKRDMSLASADTSISCCS